MFGVVGVMALYAYERSDRVTREQEHMLRPGMSKEEVKAILGRPRTEKGDVLLYYTVYQMDPIRVVFDENGGFDSVW